jgi:ABC-type sugar transport system permease subunit
MGMALILNQKFKGRSILRALILLPWATSEFATGILWSYIFKGGTVGLLNTLLNILGIIEKPITWITPGFALETVSIAFAWRMAPLAAIFLLAGLQFIQPELYKQARIDGAGVFSRFWHITLPCLKHSLLIITVLITAYAAKTADIIIVMTGGGPGFESSTLTNLVYLRTYKELKFAYGAALSWYVIAIVLVLTITVFWLMSKRPRRGES